MLYRRLEGHNLASCFYCSGDRECLDHVPPITVACDMDISDFKSKGGSLLLVPCCDTCNGLLGSKLLLTLQERTFYLYERYTKEIGKSKSMWTEDEIDELGRGLRDMIAARHAKLSSMIEKLRGVESRMLTFAD